KSMARPRKLTAVNKKHFTEEERAQRQAEEEILNGFTEIDIDDIPPFLDERGEREWFRIVPLLDELPISELDRTQVAQYCYFVSIYERCIEDIEERGLIVDDRQNPSFAMMINTSKEIKSISNAMGLTINSRMKLVAPKAAETEAEDPFMEMMND
ncbi:phage terminase small subunit P27 family, partial [Bacillus sp. mrc49]|uniref:phage terminase small subunit P27 family n=1 Tax=Bacillus sp. mrc49 TaxID=2054913 RepID=UPI000C2802C2